jgi:choline dehydrogenase
MAHDYIIVGAGSAGCALAAGLIARTDATVLLLEAGPMDRDPRVHIPAAASDLWFGKLDWAYETTAQEGFGGRVDTWPRGKVVGGSSSINAMMYVRGMDVDYDGWAAGGATGWDAATMNELFHHLEDDERGPAPHRGIGGPLRVEHQRDPSPLSQAFLDACEELGLSRVEDYHAETHGCGLTMVTQRGGRRWSAADAFLRPAMAAADGRLTVRTGVDVQRVIVEGGRAVGVDVLVDGIPRFARASQEVLLSGGAVGTPHLLLRSGIGPAEHLASVGVPVVADLPGVGENLQDHVLTGVAAGTDGDDSLYGADTDPAALLRYVTKKRGPLTSNLGEAIAFVRTRDEEAPDVELICLPVGLQDHGRVRYPEHGITVGAILLRPDSRGSIRLASADPAVPPIIDPGTFTDGNGDDLRRLSDGLRWCQRLVTDSAALGARITHLIDPTAPLTTEPQVTDHVRRTAQTLYHPVGTCRMGSDPDAVVDPDLRVAGIDGLRVADASVMPTLIRGHTNAPAIAIGERASRLVADPARV